MCDSEVGEGGGKLQRGVMTHHAWVDSLPLTLRPGAQSMGSKAGVALRTKQFVPIIKFVRMHVSEFWADSPVKRASGRFAIDDDLGIVEEDSHLAAQAPASLEQFMEALRYLVDLYVHVHPEEKESIIEYGLAMAHKEATAISMLGRGKDAVAHLFRYDKAHRQMHAQEGSVAFGTHFSGLVEMAQAQLTKASLAQDFAGWSKRSGEPGEAKVGGGARKLTARPPAASPPSTNLARRERPRSGGYNNVEFRAMDQSAQGNIRNKRLCIAFNTSAACGLPDGHGGFQHLCAKCLGTGHGFATCA